MLVFFHNDSSFQNVIFMAVTNRSNRPYLTYLKKKNLRPTLPNQLLRGIILAPGKNLCISGTPMMRLNQALLATCSRFLCRGDSQDESGGRFLEVNEIQRIFGAEGWRLWLA